MAKRNETCPVCDGESLDFDRRAFLKVAGAAAGASLLPSALRAADSDKPTPETLVKQLYESLSAAQKKDVAFTWDHQHPQWGLLRTRISNNWHITQPQIRSDFYTKDQQEMCRAIYEGLFQPDWIKRIDKQLQDDTNNKPWGSEQNIAFFGQPGEKFEMVMTGRHITVRVDGNSIDGMAFGGPVFHGHQATRTTGLNEEIGHPGNIWWPQALEANKVFEMLDGKQREKALVAQLPAEQSVGFRGKDGKFPGVTVADLSADQKAQLQKTIKLVFEPYRNADQAEVLDCLKQQGGLDGCSLAFYAQGDIGDDGVWDNWRLEGPSFVFYFRGSPHVHMWVNIGSDTSVKLNA
ncbi:MAG TPA: DUF3500 domain-containing protein [Pirellulaceae bacterium]|nr:DUF3500 domain-containing protein [Pirellulaceae bacterium]